MKELNGRTWQKFLHYLIKTHVKADKDRSKSAFNASDVQHKLALKRNRLNNDLLTCRSDKKSTIRIVMISKPVEQKIN